MIISKYATMFPALGNDELNNLAEDIGTNGLLEPITLYQGEIIDGRNRYGACEIAGVEPIYETYTGDDPLSYVISKNLTRRHLNESQRALVASGIANMGHGQKTTDTSVANLPISTQADAAEKLNISPRMVRTANKVKADAVPEVLNMVESGEIKLNEAVSIAKEDTDTQLVIIDKISSGEAASAKEAKKQIQQKSRIDAVSEVVVDDVPVYLGSAPDVLKTLPSNSVDMVLTDPPYGVDYADTRESFNPEYLDGKDYALQLLEDTCKELARVVKPNAHLYFFFAMWNFTEAKAIISKYFDLHPIPLIWVKNNHTLCDFNKRYAPKYEPIWFCSGKERNLNEKCSRDVLQFDIPRSKVHKAQKPIELLKYLIGNSTVKGETVLDCFAGSGSTLLAAKQMGRNYIGIEFDEDIYKIAVESVA